MFHVRSEGSRLRYGFNVYPWGERKWSIGFILRLYQSGLLVRYAPHIRKIYLRIEALPTIAEADAQFNEFVRGPSNA